MHTPRRSLPHRARALPLLALSLLLLGAPACQKKGAKGGGPGGDMAAGGAAASFVKDVPAAARGWLPKAREGSAFAVDGAPKRYNKETIFELLNGGADALLDLGLTSLWHVRVKDGAKVFTDLEIQVMDVTSPAKAKAMLQKEKAPDAKPEAVGDLGFSEKGQVLFAKGKHLVRVMALPSGPRKLAPILEVARQVAATPGAAW